MLISPEFIIISVLNNKQDELDYKLINGSGLGLNEGMYSIYAPNTADDMVYPGLYRLNGITVGSASNFYGYAIVMSDLGHTIIKQLIYHNASGTSLLRYRYNNQWVDAGKFALMDDLPNIHTEYNVTNNNILLRCTADDGSAIQLATTGTQIQLQKRTSSSGSFEMVWAK